MAPHFSDAILEDIAIRGALSWRIYVYVEHGIEDSKERDIEKQSYCEMEFWCQTKPRVENLHCLGCFGLQTMLSDGFQSHFAKTFFFFYVSLFAILYGAEQH